MARLLLVLVLAAAATLATIPLVTIVETIEHHAAGGERRWLVKGLVLLMGCLLLGRCRKNTPIRLTTRTGDELLR
uniref:Secreted protein n=1 Tax=Anopheles darlingi TaxID=43151 RepID=A0A2M4DQB8_ANODA